MAPILPPLWDALLGNLSQSSALLVYAFVDPLQLQIVAFVSAVSQVVFFVLQRPPVVIFAFWDSLQALINLIQIVILSLELVPVRFSEREVEVLTLMSYVFDEIPSRKIARLLRRCGARWARYPTGCRVVTFRHGRHDELVFVVEGGVNAYASDGTLAIEARPGSFLAEAELSEAMLDDEGARVDEEDDVAHLEYATASTQTLCLVWPVEKLAKHLKRDDELRDAFRQALAVDLCRKIHLESRRRSLSGSGSPETLYTAVFGRPKFASSLSPPKMQSSRRARRKGHVLSVMGFVNSGSKRTAERVKFLDNNTRDSYDSTASGRVGPIDGHVVKPVAKPSEPTRRPPPTDERIVLGAAFANLAIALALAVGLGFLVYLVKVHGPSEVVGNGSQAIITGAFAITDPLTLQIVSFVGSTAQASFFIFRPPLIWSSVAWSSAQAVVNFVMAIVIKRSITRQATEDRPRYSDRELFAARCLQRAAPLDLAVLHALLVGSDQLAPVWRTLARGEDLASDGRPALAILTDGAVRVTTSDGLAYDASPGSLLGARAIFDDHLHDAPERAQALQPSELLAWPATQLAAYLETNQDARFAFSVLAASTATASYLDDTPSLDNII